MRVPLIVATILSEIWLGASVPRARAGEVSGPYATRLSQSDVVQIKVAVSGQRGISHNVRKIEAVRPDKVAIQTGGKTGLDSATYYDFNVYKRSGKWIVETSSIETSFESVPNHRLDSDATGR